MITAKVLSGGHTVLHNTDTDEQWRKNKNGSWDYRQFSTGTWVRSGQRVIPNAVLEALRERMGLYNIT